MNRQYYPPAIQNKLYRFFSAVVFTISLLFCNEVFAESQQKFGDWQLNCKETCILFQGLSNPNKPDIVYAVQASKIESEKTIVLQFNFPLGIYIPTGITFSSGKFTQNIPFTVCIPTGCKALVTINEDLYAALASNDKLTARFFIVEKTPIEIQFSLKGFVDGYKKL